MTINNMYKILNFLLFLILLINILNFLFGNSYVLLDDTSNINTILEENNNEFNSNSVVIPPSLNTKAKIKS